MLEIPKVYSQKLDDGSIRVTTTDKWSREEKVYEDYSDARLSINKSERLNLGAFFATGTAALACGAMAINAKLVMELDIKILINFKLD